MVIFMNPMAGGGRGAGKWKRFKETLPRTIFPPTAYVMNGRASTVRRIRMELQRGELQFVAAGGDGTLNFILNTILSVASPESVPALQFGAVGIGSSNDFHKPWSSTNGHTRIPTRIDFASAEPCDVGYLTCEVAGKSMSRYFLVNASAGLTADANHCFNHPRRFLSFLKRGNTEAAILYSAIRTIARYTNRQVTISSPETGDFTTDLTNIGIVKNPHVSGGLRYDTPLELHNGLFDVHLTYGMSRREIMSLLLALHRGDFRSVKKRLSWRTSSLSLSAPLPFAVEYDGEVISTREVHFGVLHNYLKVCTC